MKIIKFKFLFSILAIFSLSLVSCEEDVASDFSVSSSVLIEQYKYVGIEEDATITVEGKVVASEASGSDRTFNLVVKGTTTHSSAYYDVPATVTIPAGQKVGVFLVDITGTNIGTGKKIVVGLEQQPGVNIGITNYTTDTEGVVTSVSTRDLTFDIKQVCYDNRVDILIVTDRYGSETEWELYNDLDFGNPVASGGPYADQSASGAYPQPVVELCLVNGNYTFVVYDLYDDGMDSGYGTGYYRITKYDTNGTATVIAQNGVFTSSDVVTFSLP